MHPRIFCWDGTRAPCDKQNEQRVFWMGENGFWRDSVSMHSGAIFLTQEVSDLSLARFTRSGSMTSRLNGMKHFQSSRGIARCFIMQSSDVSRISRRRANQQQGDEIEGMRESRSQIGVFQQSLNQRGTLR